MYSRIESVIDPNIHVEQVIKVKIAGDQVHSLTSPKQNKVFKKTLKTADVLVDKSAAYATVWNNQM